MIGLDYAGFARRNGCRLKLVDGSASDRAGKSLGLNPCERCFGCDQGLGDLGLTSNGMKIVGYQGGAVDVVWNCPGCGRETVEASPLLATEETARGAEADPLCYRCRAKAVA